MNMTRLGITNSCLYFGQNVISFDKCHLAAQYKPPHAAAMHKTINRINSWTTDAVCREDLQTVWTQIRPV